MLVNATALDVAEYILQKKPRLSAMKLQKLVYYSQAWALAWTEEPLFQEDIEAWRNGPVTRSLWDRHSGSYSVQAGQFQPGDPRNLSEDQKDTIDRVIDHYGDKSPQWLSDLTHMEEPWRKARGTLPDDCASNEIISKASMLEYYSSL